MSNGTGRRAGPSEGAARGGMAGGMAAALMTGDPTTALAVAGITALAAGLGNWGRANQGADGVKGFLAAVFGSLGG